MSQKPSTGGLPAHESAPQETPLGDVLTDVERSALERTAQGQKRFHDQWLAKVPPDTEPALVFSVWRRRE